MKRIMLALSLTSCIASLLLLLSSSMLYAGNNYSASFGIVFTPAFVDTTPPAKVTDFSAKPGKNEGEVELSWSMPGDDGWVNSLPAGSQFKIQYSTAPDGTGGGKTGWDYRNAQIAQSTSGVIPTTLVTYVVTALSPGVEYYFRIWHCDEAQNYSDISNAATAQATLIDRVPPEVAITFPQNNAFYNYSSLLTISGTARDNVAISTVQISIRDLSYPATYWNGVDSWVSSHGEVVWLAVSSYSAESALWIYTSKSMPSWQNGKSYMVVARAQDAASNFSDRYSTATFTFDAEAPVEVGFQSIVSILPTVIVTTGTAKDTLSGIAGVSAPYYIQRSTDGITWGNYDSGWVASNYTWIGLTPNTTYWFRIKARDAAGNESPWSSPAATKVTLSNVPVKSYIVSRSSWFVQIAWSENGNPSYTKWGILRSTDAFTASSTIIKDFSSNYTALSYIDYNVLPGTTYWYKVCAYNEEGIQSEFDVAVSTRTLYPDVVPPAQVSDLTAHSTSIEGEVLLTWTFTGDDGYSNVLQTGMFIIQYSSHTNEKEIAWSTAAAAQVIISTSNISPGTVLNYTFTLKSNVVLAAAKDLPPAKVASLKAEATGESGKILLSWKFNTEVDIKEYRVYRSTVSGAIPSSQYMLKELQPVKIIPKTQNVWEDTSLINHITYYYRIVAVDLSGKESEPSEEVSAYPYSIVSNTEIAGKVTQRDGQPLALVLCEAILLPSAVVTEGDIAAKGTVVKKVYSDVEGAYIFSGLSAGTTYVIRVSLAEFSKQSIVFREVLSGTSKVDFTLEIQYKLGAIVGMLSGYSYKSLSFNATQATASQQQKQKCYRSISELQQQEGIQPYPYIEVYRADYAERASEIRLYVPVKPDGTYEIRNLLPGRYIIRAYNGVVYSAPVSVYLAEGEVKSNIALSFPELPQELVKAYPNPTRIGEINIEFYTTYPSPEATISIYDLAGQLVKKVPPEDILPAASSSNSKPQGTYIYKWRCINDNNRRVASGVYIYVLKVRDRDTQRTSKVVKKFAVIW